MTNDKIAHKYFLEDKPIEFATKEDKYKFYINELKKAFDDIVWMAIRYANNRSTYAPGMVREACEVRAKFGNFHLKQDDTLEDITTHNLKGDNLKDLIKKFK